MDLESAVERVCADYLNRADAEVRTAVEREIQLAIDHYAPHRFGFNEARLTFTLSATSVYDVSAIAAANTVGSISYGLVDGWDGSGRPPYSIVDSRYTFVKRLIEVDEIVVVHSSTRHYDLEPVSWGEMVRLRSTPNLRGGPTYYTIYQNKLYLDSAPSESSLDAYIDAHVEISPIAENPDRESVWLDNAEELILTRAARMVAMKKLQDFELASMYEKLEAEALASAETRGNKRQGIGRIVGHL